MQLVCLGNKNLGLGHNEIHFSTSRFFKVRSECTAGRSLAEITVDLAFGERILNVLLEPLQPKISR